MFIEFRNVYPNIIWKDFYLFIYLMDFDGLLSVCGNYEQKYCYFSRIIFIRDQTGIDRVSLLNDPRHPLYPHTGVFIYYTWLDLGTM